MTEEKLSVKWEPSVLTFPVAINKVSVQHLRAFNNSTVTAYTYKVKTTNPKRYSVRPNVGVMFPGEEAAVTVQLPLVKELPPDMAKCKDKFQVLTLALSEARAAEVRDLPAEQRRAVLAELWGNAEAVKDATIDKIRCAFTLDATARSEPIPEEDGPLSPFSPEPRPGHELPASTPAAPTPVVAAHALEPVVSGTPVDLSAMTASAAPESASGAEDPPEILAEDVRAAMAAERSALEAEARGMAVKVQSLEEALEAQQRLTKRLQAQLERAQAAAPPPQPPQAPPAHPTGPSGPSGRSSVSTLLLLVVTALAAFAYGRTTAPAATPAVVPPAGVPCTAAAAAPTPAGLDARAAEPAYAAGGGADPLEREEL